MFNYILRRLILMIPTLIGITAVAFFIMALSPGGVGGSLMNASGEVDARQIQALREYYNRRYGLDQPLVVQYMRWLNRVSPVGFVTSSQITYTDDQVAKVKQIINGCPQITTHTQQQQTLAIIETLASYTEEDAAKTAEQFTKSLASPNGARKYFAELDVHSDMIMSQLDEAKKKGPSFEIDLLLTKLGDEAAGADRVLFDHPAFKAPDLGMSISKGQSVIELYKTALPITLLLNAITTPIIYLIAITIGIYAARHRGKAFDVGSGVVLMGLWSAPVMWVGVMLIGFLASDQYLHWFPAGGLSDTLASQMAFLPHWTAAGFARGWLLDRMWHLVLPIVCLTYGGFAFMAKLVRSSMLENLSSDFIRTARAKGVEDRVVLWRHAFRNSLLPLITFAAFLIPSLLAGSLIVEKIFSINGMGLLTINAIYSHDRELVMAGALISGLLSLISVLIADLCYAIADPRVSYE